MNKTTIVFADGTEVNLESNESLSQLTAVFQSAEEMAAAWKKFTVANLKKFAIKIDESVNGEYEDYVLSSETSVIQNDESIRTSFVIRQKTEVEMLRERIAALEAGQGVQDGAIEDLGTVTSTLAEQVEGGVQ